MTTTTAAPRTTTQQAMRAALVIVGALVSFNGAFFGISSIYFSDHPTDAATMLKVRGAFAIMTAIVAVATFGAALAPRIIAHALSVVQGLALLVGGYFSLARDLPVVLGVTQLVLGLLLPTLAYASWRHSRVSWSFLISALVVLAIVDFFGAPKVRVVLGVGLWTAMILPGLQVVTVIALSMVRGEYREGAAVEQRPIDLGGVPSYFILLWLLSAAGFLAALIGAAVESDTVGIGGGIVALVCGGASVFLRKFPAKKK
jgi:hypothetical protein